VKQLEPFYVHFITKNFFFLLGKFYAYGCGHVNMTMGDYLLLRPKF